MTTIAIIGAAGKMGRRLVALAREHGGEVVSAIVSDGHGLLGHDAGEHAGIGRIDVAYSSEITGCPQVLIDFSSPAGTRRWLAVARDRGLPIVIGTTGLGPQEQSLIDESSRQIPILQAPNMSVGVAVLTELVRRASVLLGPGCELEIVEAHHRTKKDAPSGTALALARAVEARSAGEIATHSLRLGDEVGTHTVYFALAGERLEMTHRALNRDIFARGALRAALWLTEQQPGRYGIFDMLGLG